MSQVIIRTLNTFSGLKMVFFKLNQYITTCLKICVYSNFSLSYFMTSVIEKGLNKSFSVYKNLCLYKSISYKHFCTNLSKVMLEILRNSSTIFRSSHWSYSMKKFCNICRKTPVWSLSLMKLKGALTCFHRCFFCEYHRMF